MIEIGEMNWNGANEANIPVDIWLSKYPSEEPESDEFNYDGKIYNYCLKAANYMPRKDRIAEEAYIALSDDLEELQNVIKNKVLPLYKTAVNVLEHMATLKNFKETKYGLVAFSLYYWEIGTIYRESQSEVN